VVLSRYVIQELNSDLIDPLVLFGTLHFSCLYGSPLLTSSRSPCFQRMVGTASDHHHSTGNRVLPSYVPVDLFRPKLFIPTARQLVSKRGTSACLQRFHNVNNALFVERAVLLCLIPSDSTENIAWLDVDTFSGDIAVEVFRVSHCWRTTTNYRRF